MVYRNREILIPVVTIRRDSKCRQRIIIVIIWKLRLKLSIYESTLYLIRKILAFIGLVWVLLSPLIVSSHCWNALIVLLFVTTSLLIRIESEINQTCTFTCTLSPPSLLTVRPMMVMIQIP